MSTDETTKPCVTIADRVADLARLFKCTGWSAALTVASYCIKPFFAGCSKCFLLSTFTHCIRP
ncbi:hypothetical protein DPMN_006368 [Dreissena polymorpha]|uniref:Uncharacterized protein n=1 Tax=Dreissena polymorpha TaxID=45954 RepID=A0A9D4MVA9_DREPO|nr:hypothetical protein DPMN_006368 [Dreissena polymorpha]